MTEYISHRVNTVEELLSLPREYGVELDLRDAKDGSIIISHDPFQNGEDFEDYLKQYNHGTMILNIKSERIEHKILELIKKYDIKNYFFLDSSFPMIYSLSRGGEKNMALRFSEFEGDDTIKSMQGKVNWIWVDCFTKLPITLELFEKFKSLDYKLCLVSPELQGREDDIVAYRDYLRANSIVFDAICTKKRNFNLWKETR